jgi:hypothetical protein
MIGVYILVILDCSYDILMTDNITFKMSPKDVYGVVYVKAVDLQISQNISRKSNLRIEKYIKILRKVKRFKIQLMIYKYVTCDFKTDCAAYFTIFLLR